jgi:hypothetical protein
VNEAHIAFEKWAYGEGLAAGLIDGRKKGFDEGWVVGFDTGIEVGSERMLLALERVLEERLPGLFDDLLPLLPLPEVPQLPAGEVDR